ncbi:hypothetical protein SKAU_G00114340 [Synaphobranchus kaupii]|uniref:Uncharacterized protein n=1 Tax=Synaphobranchus kaupii TaxID=118154 RepID=A0A9Q1G275_SYNKA|nr:hypothetical protein SKAU_G00114340 [Synaphobranchus kaupii]
MKERRACLCPYAEGRFVDLRPLFGARSSVCSYGALLPPPVCSGGNLDRADVFSLATFPVGPARAEPKARVSSQLKPHAKGSDRWPIFPSAIGVLEAPITL